MNIKDIGENEISAELDRVLSSDDFQGKPVLARLLTYLVRECLEGRSEQIKGYSIGVDLFARGGDFDPDSGALVRNNAARLRGVLRTYYLGAGANDPVQIGIPKGHYIPSFTRKHCATERTASLSASTEQKNKLTPAGVAVLPFRNLSTNPDYDFMATGVSFALSDALSKYEDLRVVAVTQRDDSALTDDYMVRKNIGFVVGHDPLHTRLQD